MSADKAKGFLDFIVAHPDDDVHRLVFADWYEEQGDAARAEFIRVQVEIARLPEWDVRQVTLRLRQRALLKQHGTQWKAELPTIKGVKWGEFRRGLVGAATFDSYSVLRKQAGACWAAAPIEAISIRWPRPRERVETLPPIPGLRELSINAMLVDPLEVDRLAATPLLSTLRVLEMSNCSVGTDSFRRLLASPQLGNLTALRVPANAIGNGGISALFDAASLTGLTELDLSESDGGGGGGGGGYGRYGEDPIVESLGMRALAGWPGLAQLRSLKLSGNQAGRDGLRALLRSPHARGLKELAFRANHLDGPAVQEFCDAHPDLELEVLDLGANLLRELGAAYLARSSCLRELKELKIDRCEIPPSGARELARSGYLGNLRRLNLDNNNFGPEGMDALLELKLPHLHTLQLCNNDLGDEGVTYLAESPFSNSLLDLDLSQNDLWTYSAEALAATRYFKNLILLRLGHNHLDKQAQSILAGSPLGQRLSSLYMGKEA